MSTLLTLQKLASQKVEAKQKEIAKLESVILQMTERQEYLNKAIVTEHKIAAEFGDPMLFSAAGMFQEKAQVELHDLAEAMEDAKRIMMEKREKLRALYAEQKRYEILHERQEVKKKKEREKKGQSVLDDLAGARKRLLEESS